MTEFAILFVCMVKQLSEDYFQGEQGYDGDYISK